MSKMKKKQVFDKEYLLVVLLVLSIILEIVYMISYHVPEWFEGGGLLFSFFYQMSLAYVASYLFYYLTVELPRRNKAKRSAPLIRMYLVDLLNNMRIIYNELEKCRLEGTQKFDVDRESRVLDINFINADEKKYLSVRSCLEWAINNVRKDIEHIVYGYENVVSTDLFHDLEKTSCAFVVMPQFMDVLRRFTKVEFCDEDVVEECRTIVVCLEGYDCGKRKII